MLQHVLAILQQIDADAFMQVYQWRQPLLDQVMPWVTHLGSGGVLWLGWALLLFVFGSTRDKRAAILTVVALTVSFIISQELIKELVGRNRPYLTLDGVVTLVHPLNSTSFPSGHTTTSFACAVVLARTWGRMPPLPIMLAALIGFSRIYVGVHYPTDVIVGGLIGIVCGEVICRLAAKKYPEIKIYHRTGSRDYSA
ncbi:phosphatase PAP2 family protein [Peptococcaceae bacterium 1198_IL3148]